ncbi:MAG TPA: thioredoxin family protein [Acidobacteriota bacterium]|nr:thioredoxin family protein [Acidobacteriota bacterium]
MTRTNRILIWSACLVTALLQTAFIAAVAAEDSQFVRFSQYEVEVDGEADSQAAIYRSVRPPAFLLRVPRISSNYFRLDPAHQKVEWIGHESVSAGAGTDLLLRDGSESRQVGTYQVQGSSVSLKIDGHAVRLVPRKPLLELHSSQDLIEYDLLYQRRAQAYQPDEPSLRELRQVGQEATVTVYFGSWCSHCQQKVPYILRLQQELEATPLRFQYFGLPRGFGNHPKARELKLQWVPTAVVTRDGEEIGRVEGHDWDDPPELKLARILK